MLDPKEDRERPATRDKSSSLDEYFGWVIVELAPDAIFVVDQAGRFVLANRRAEEMFGYDRDTLQGLGVEALIPARFGTAHRAHRATYETSPATRPMGIALDLWGLRADGSEFPVEISLSPVTVSDGLHVVVIVRDLTDRLVAGWSERPDRRTLVDQVSEVELHQVVINHLMTAGLDIASVMESVEGDQAERLLRAAHQLDYVIREINAASLSASPGLDPDPR